MIYVMNMIIEIEKSSKSFKSSENQSSDNGCPIGTTGIMRNGLNGRKTNK
jgi:hypothetical protein